MVIKNALKTSPKSSPVAFLLTRVPAERFKSVLQQITAKKIHGLEQNP